MSYKETLMDIKSIQTKIDQTTAQINRLRSKLKMLEHKKQQLENEHIIELVREENMTLAELDEFLKSHKEGKLDKWIEQRVLR